MVLVPAVRSVWGTCVSSLVPYDTSIHLAPLVSRTICLIVSLDCWSATGAGLYTDMQA